MQCLFTNNPAIVDITLIYLFCLHICDVKSNSLKKYRSSRNVYRDNNKQQNWKRERDKNTSE